MTKTLELQSYWDSPAWSQSRLKAIMCLGKGDKSDSKALFAGNVVDTAVTNKECFNLIYHVGSQKKPSEEIQRILKEVFEKRNSNEFEKEKESIIGVCRNFGYQNTYKEETLYNTISKHSYYWNDMLESEGKIVISQEERDEAFAIRNVLLNHNNTKHIFQDTLMTEAKYQVALYGNINEVQCKGLPDILLFDYGFKTIQEIDLKKTGNHRNSFNYPAKEFRYDLQKAFYKELIQINYPEFEVLPGLWLVVPKDINKPFIRECSMFDYNMGKWGGQYHKGVMHTPLAGTEQVLEQDNIDHIFGFMDCLEVVKQAQLLNTNDYDLEYTQTTIYKGSIWG